MTLKLKCPKCLFEVRERAKAARREVQHIDRKLSLVCNASPQAPHDGDPCCCGADWIPQDTTGKGSDDDQEDTDDCHDV